MTDLLDKYRKNPIKEEIKPFLSSINEDLWILKEDVIGSIGHVIMLHEQKILSKKEMQLILKELLNILNQIKNGSFHIDSSFEDIHPQIETMIIEKIGIEVGGKIHSARSRNDQVALDIRLKIRYEISQLIFSLKELVISILDLSKKNINTYCPLYTHLQRGQLGTFAHLLNNYASQIIRMIKKLILLFEEININPLGACAIGGTSFPIDRKRISELFGFTGEVFNSIDAVSSRDHLISTMMVLTLLADAYTRICEDLVIWSSDEFDFIELDDQYSSVSSAMPQKKNPDSVELIKGKMGRIYGGLTHILMMSKGTPTGYNRDFQESKVSLTEAFSTINFSTRVLTGVFATMKVNPKRMELAINESLVLALDLSEYLAQNYALSFRESHQIIGALIKMSPNIDDVFNALKIKEICMKILGKDMKINQKAITELKDPKIALDRRKSLGSPNKESILKNFEIIELELNKSQIELDRIIDIVVNSEKKLIELAEKLISE